MNREAQLTQDSQSIPLTVAHSVVIKARDSAIQLQGGATSLLDATFTYDATERQPPTLGLTDGLLQVTETRDHLLTQRTQSPSLWDLRFGEQPLAYQVNVASGDVYVDGSALLPTELMVRSASGDVGLLMPSTYTDFQTLEVQTASGDGRIDLSGDCPALTSLKLSSASGEIRAALGGDFAALTSLHLQNSSGALTVGLTGVYHQHLAFEVQNTSGLIALDLQGDWQADVEGKLHTTSGKVVLALPTHIGVIISAKTMSGGLRVQGLERKGDAYVNAAYGRSGRIMRLDLRSVSGSFDLMCMEGVHHHDH